MKLLIEKSTVKQLLEALEGMQNAIYNIEGEHVIGLSYATEEADVAQQAIITVKEALAQPAQEPDWKEQYEYQKRRAEMWIAKYEKDIGPLEKVQPAQEPTGVLHIERLDKWLDASLKERKQREWVGLTDSDFCREINTRDFLAGAFFAEAKLKEKNND